MFSSPGLAGEPVYVGVSNGWLLAIDAKSGKLVCDFQTEGSKQDPINRLKPDGSFNNEVIYHDIGWITKNMIVVDKGRSIFGRPMS